MQVLARLSGCSQCYQMGNAVIVHLSGVILRKMIVRTIIFHSGVLSSICVNKTSHQRPCIL